MPTLKGFETSGQAIARRWGKSALTVRLEEGRDSAPTTTRCSLCDFTHDGTAAEGREAHRAHRVAEHPKELQPAPRRRRRKAAA